MRIRTSTRTALTVLSAVTLALGAGAGAALPASAAPSHPVSSTASSLPAQGASPQVLTWSPYDYSRITTAAKCQSRMNSLKAMNPPNYRWMCQRFQAQVCPVTNYWYVMIADANGTRAIPAEKTTAALAPAC